MCRPASQWDSNKERSRSERVKGMRSCTVDAWEGQCSGGDAGADDDGVVAEEVEVVGGVDGDTRSGEEQPLAPTTHSGV